MIVFFGSLIKINPMSFLIIHQIIDFLCLDFRLLHFRIDSIPFFGMFHEIGRIGYFGSFPFNR